MAVGDTSDRYDPYADYLPNDLKLKTKIGLLYAWKARAQQYLAEKNPLATYRTVDENKFAWTLKDIYHVNYFYLNVHCFSFILLLN